MINWSELLEGALNKLGEFLHCSKWYGRENELVNLFAHSFLLGKQSSILNPSQLGIEVAVKQLPHGDSRAKALVRKDLVIWDKPDQTVWTNTGEIQNFPAVIVEFKVGDDRKCKSDIAWLRSFSREHPQVLGYSVCGFCQDERVRGVTYHRIRNGHIESEVLVPSEVRESCRRLFRRMDT